MLQKAIFEVEGVALEVNKESIIPSIRISNATSFFGVCKRKPKGFEISVSKYHLSNEINAVYQTIVHEVLHTIKGCMNHGSKWKECANTMNEVYGYNISRLGTMKSGAKLNTPPKLVKYIITCQKCSKVYKRKVRSKLVKNVDNYKCGECGGALKLEK